MHSRRAPPMAFVPNLPLRSSSFASSATTPSPPKTPRAASRAPRRAAACSTGAGIPDFDEVARQLSKDLQVRRAVDAADSAPMPPPDAAPDDMPFVITVGNNDMPKLILRHPPTAQQAEVYLYGAAVTSWTTRGEDHFWVSDTNKWQLGGKAIRGGIPICFPQFGPYGDLMQHGFARVSDWVVRDTFVADDTSVSAVFTLDNAAAGDQAADWPAQFVADYMVTLSAAGLETKLTVKNTGDKQFSFTCAFHNYFKTSNVSDLRVFGTEGVSFRDRLSGDAEQPPEEDSGAGVQLTKETDRIYTDAPEELAIFDFSTLKVLKIKKTSTLADATLWNPFGAEGADPGWKNFICVEPACIAKPASLEPGETWVGAQLLGVE